MLLAANLHSATPSLICLVISLVLLAIAAFIGPVETTGSFWKRFNFLAAGLFFFVLSVALS